MTPPLALIRPFLIALAVLTGSLLLEIAVAAPASAHAELVSSTPGDGQNCSVAPRSLRLVMSESVELRYTKVTLTDGLGRQSVLTGMTSGPAPAAEPSGSAAELPADADAEPGESPVTITVPLPELPPDLYRLAWSTVSSDDLHSTSGTVTFGVRRAVPAAGARPADPLPGAADVVLHWVALVGMAAAVGAGLLLLLSRTGPGSGLRRALLLGSVGAVVSALAGVGTVLVRAEATGPHWFGSIGPLLAGHYGLRWGAAELTAVAAATLAARALAGARSLDPAGGADPAEPAGWDRRRFRFAIGLLASGTCFSLALALTGHAGAGQQPVRLLTETVHLAAAITWVAAIVAGFAVGRAVLPRLALIAAGCLTALIITGLLLTGQGVASVDAALSATYGRLLLLKLLLVGLTLIAAAVTAVTARASAAPGRSRIGGPRRALAIEAVALGAVLLAAAALGSTRPATGPDWAAPVQAQPMISATAADLVETLQVSPNLPGRNFLTLDVFDTRRPSPAPITAVRVGFSGPDGRRQVATAVAQGARRWLLPSDAFSSPGRWVVDVHVLRTGYPDASHRYEWVVADPAARSRRVLVSDQPLRPLLDRITLALLALLALTAVGVRLHPQVRGRRRVSSAPPSGAASARHEPPNTSATAATSANPSPVPGSSPTGCR